MAKLKKTPIIIIGIIIILTIIIIIPKGETNPLNIALNDQQINNFVKQTNESVKIDTLNTQEIQNLKNSTLGALYAPLPDNKTIYQVIITDENQDGYLIFIDAETNQIIKKMGIHNLII